MERPATEADKKYEKWLKEKSNGILVAASLTATMAYTTALTPPGGVWQENYNEIPPGTTYFSRRVGLSVLAESNPHGLTGFSALLGFNTVGFICSITVILLLIHDLPVKKRAIFWMVVSFMAVACYCQAFSYALIFGNIVPDGFKIWSIQLKTVLMISMFIFCTLQVSTFASVYNYGLRVAKETVPHQTSR